MRQAEADDLAADEPRRSKSPARKFVIISGTSATPHMVRLTQRFAPDGTQVRVVTILNHFFGETITVTGLLTGGDTLAQIPQDALDGADALLISCNMLRHERDMFLDDMTLSEFESRLPVPVRIVDDGYDLYEAIHGR
ncbi:MAG: DUF512 domain-containing protein, partial [Candidatus Limiplasma sp.]|nr:DUF512 domain-containing protein [Candidatus Limiplasma sp.]